MLILFLRPCFLKSVKSQSPKETKEWLVGNAAVGNRLWDGCKSFDPANYI